MQQNFDNTFTNHIDGKRVAQNHRNIPKGRMHNKTKSYVIFVQRFAQYLASVGSG
jgi:hypothetical protein